MSEKRTIPGRRLFAPCVMLPVQLDGPHFITKLPEYALWRTVLEDAIACLHECLSMKKPTLTRYKKAKEAWDWIFDDDESHPGAFRVVCALLGENVTYARVQVQQRYAGLRFLHTLPGYRLRIDPEFTPITPRTRGKRRHGAKLIGGHYQYLDDLEAA